MRPEGHEPDGLCYKLELWEAEPFQVVMLTALTLVLLLLLVLLPPPLVVLLPIWKFPMKERRFINPQELSTMLRDSVSNRYCDFGAMSITCHHREPYERSGLLNVQPPAYWLTKSWRRDVVSVVHKVFRNGSSVFITASFLPYRSDGLVIWRLM